MTASRPCCSPRPAASQAASKSKPPIPAVTRLALAPQWQPGLMVIDLHLPDMLGYALLPGFDGYWPKPVPPATLRNELARRSAAA